MTLFDDVGAFHAKFDLPTEGEQIPDFMSDRDRKYRVAFMLEEITEFIDACGRRDLADAADALADLVWVALGTAHYMHLPFDEVWAEVKRANMEKRPWQEGDPLKPRNTTTSGEIVKPEGWLGPRVQRVLEHHTLALLNGRD